MTKRDEILNHIAQDQMVEKLISRICPAISDRDDLTQYIYLKLSELDPDRLVEMSESGSLVYYIARIIINQVFSGSSYYYKYYTSWLQNKSNIDGIEIREES